MPQFIGWLVNGLLVAAGSFFVQALTGVGVAMVITEYAVSPIMDAISDALSGTSAVLVDMFVFVGGDRAMTIVLSALALSAGAKRIQGIKRK